MSDVLTQAKRNVLIIGCGGGGTNISYNLEKLRNSNELGFATAEIVYVDASRSNMRADIPAKAVYLIDGLDGSGKVRSENHSEIGLRVKDILQRFRPGDLVIVISTLAGGTGSVISPLLVKELLMRGIPTIVIGVGDTTTRLDTENTLKSIQSFEHIAKKADVPVVMQYLENSERNSRAEIDKQVKQMVGSLCSLFSGENRELDSKDLFNFLNFSNPKVTTYQAQLATLHLLGRDDDFNGLGNIISVASLLSEGEAFSLPVRPEYATYGYQPRGVNETVAKGAPYHFVIADGVVPEVVSELEKIIGTLNEQQEARLSRRSILGSAARPDESGLIL
jgi:hypothetical protein